MRREEKAVFGANTSEQFDHIVGRSGKTKYRDVLGTLTMVPPEQKVVDQYFWKGRRRIGKKYLGCACLLFSVSKRSSFPPVVSCVNCLPDILFIF